MRNEFTRDVREITSDFVDVKINLAEGVQIVLQSIAAKGEAVFHPLSEG